MRNSKLLLYGFVAILMFSYVSSAIYAESNFPQQIISLSPALTEELYLLGVEDRLVANTVYCKRPPAAEEKEKIGTVIKADIEKIVSLKPDVVIALLAASMTSPERIEKLKNLGIRVVSFPLAKDFQQICKQFLRLGELVGKEKEAEEIVKKAKLKVSSIQQRINGLPKPKVLVQIGAKPLWVATKDSFINNFIELAGGANIGPSGKSGLYSREKILEQNPDVIIIVTMGIVGEQEKKTWQKYKTLNAAKNNRIYIVDSDKVCSPTPVSFVEVLEEIVGLIHSNGGITKNRVKM